AAASTAASTPPAAAGAGTGAPAGARARAVAAGTGTGTVAVAARTVGPPRAGAVAPGGRGSGQQAQVAAEVQVTDQARTGTAVVPGVPARVGGAGGRGERQEHPDAEGVPHKLDPFEHLFVTPRCRCRLGNSSTSKGWAGY